MTQIVKVSLFLNVDNDSQAADVTNELLRVLQKSYTPDSCLIDYAIHGQMPGPNYNPPSYIENDFSIPTPPYRYTFYCREESGKGTTWIDTIGVDEIIDPKSEASVKKACLIAERLCAQEWEFEPADVRCIGITCPDTEIIFFE